MIGGCVARVVRREKLGVVGVSVGVEFDREAIGDALVTDSSATVPSACSPASEFWITKAMPSAEGVDAFVI